MLNGDQHQPRLHGRGGTRSGDWAHAAHNHQRHHRSVSGHPLPVRIPVRANRTSPRLAVAEPGRRAPAPYTFCSAHWFDLLPGVGNGDLLVEAFHGQGTRFIDYSNPAHPTQVGYYAPAGRIAFLPKYHDGLIYAGSYSNGIDVLRFTPAAS